MLHHIEKDMPPLEIARKLHVWRTGSAAHENAREVKCGIGQMTGAQPLQDSEDVYDKSRCDKLNRMATGYFYEYTWRRAA